MPSLGCWNPRGPSCLPTTRKPRDIVPGEAAGGRQGRGTPGGQAGRVPCPGVPLSAPRQRPSPALPRRAPPGWPAAGRGGGRSRRRRSRAGFLAGQGCRRAAVAAWAGPENFVGSAWGGGAPVSVRRQPPLARHGRPPRPRDVLGQAGPGLPGRGRAVRPGAAGRPRLPRVAARLAAPPRRPPRPAAAAVPRLGAAAAAGVRQAGPGPGGAGGAGPGGETGPEPGREAPPGGEHPPAPDQHLPERPHLAAPPPARALASAVSTAEGRWGRGRGAVPAPAAAVAQRAAAANWSVCWQRSARRSRVSLKYLSLRSVEDFGNFLITNALGSQGSL